jgi:tetratricopeptide (TPR) repeat protein
MRTWAILLLSLALGACAVVPPAVDAGQLFADHLFGPASQPISAKDVFALNAGMRQYVVKEIGQRPNSRSRQQALVEALRGEGQLKLEYDSAFTRNAAEAYEARTGNCLSLVIMTAALAKEMGVTVRYQKMDIDETWSRRGNIYFSVGHVNLTLGRAPHGIGSRIDDGEQLTVDFLPPPDMHRVRWRVVEEKTILAMFMNNRAAEALAAGQVDDAYWYAREAIRQDPDFASSYNTLGVIYQHGGHLQESARILAYALGREPSNTHVLSNLAPILASLGRIEESRELERRLARLQPEPPFAFFNRGLAAMREGDYRAAKDLFMREVDRDPYYHEFHFWLALALSNLGEVDKARQHLALAMENSSTRNEHDLYAAKLGRIKASRLQ